MTTEEHIQKVLTDDSYAERMGNIIAHTLYLRQKDGRFNTSYGRKSYIGLARTVFGVFVEDYVNKNEIQPS